MTDVEILTEQIEAIRADIEKLSSRDAYEANHRDLATLRGSLSLLIKSRREALEAEERSEHQRWVRQREREIWELGGRTIPAYGGTS